MDAQELTRVVREEYPFPIAYAYKKTLGVPDENVEKLKCLLETAETTIQFLALLALAQVRHDLLHDTAPNPGKLQEAIALTNPSMGKWKSLACEALRAYATAKEQLLVPELFDVFWVWDAARQRFGAQPSGSKAIDPLIVLRNDFHHGRVPDSEVRQRVTEGLQWLQHLLAAIRFITRYQLSFTQRILLSQDPQRKTCYVHDLTLFNGCVSGFDRQRWQSDIHLEPDAVILLNPQERRHLILNPFVIFTAQAQGVADLCLLNNLVQKKAIYVSCQFGKEVATNDANWTAGRSYYEALQEFSDRLQRVAQASPLAPSPDEAGEMPGALAEDSLLSTAEVFDQKYRRKAHVVAHASPYKFLDYYNPEDQDIFFGRDQEIRGLLQKFYQSRLLVLHGESGTGKTSLIRAGLIPQLDSESYIPVYVRVLKEPLQEIKRELIRQLGARPDRFSETCQVSLAEFLSQITEQVNKTVVLVLDQFEEFFLRFSEEVRAQFAQELATCIDAPRLDVKVLIALRADYFSCLASFEAALPQIFTHQLQLERLTEAQALDAVLKPAQRLGIQIDEPMVQIKLLPDLLAEEGGIEAPLLQIVCAELYEHAQREGRREIGLADYEAIGDVKSCLGRYLETKLRQFGKEQRTAKAVFKALVTSEGTKRASFLPELLSRIHTFGVEIAEETLPQKYLDKFIRDRLVRVEEVEGEARYELSHDYLAKQIEAWLAESEREVTKALELIDRAYETYRATNVLLERSALQMIKPFEEQLVLPTDKQTFVAHSKTQVRKQRRGLWLKVAAALMFVALVVGGIFGYQTYLAYQETLRQKEIAEAKQREAEEQRQKAEQQTDIAKQHLQQSQINEIEALIQSSKSLFLMHNEIEALLSAIKTGQRAKQITIPDILRYQFMGTFQDIISQMHEKNRLAGHKNAVQSVAFSPDGTLLASSSHDNTIKLWNVADGRELYSLQGHSESVVSVAFSPDGKLLASGSMDKTIKLWRVADGQELYSMQLFEKARSVAFSPDGRLLAAGGWNSIVKIWEISESDYRQFSILMEHSLEVMSVAFSPNGTLLATGGTDGTINLWMVAEGQKIRTLSVSKDAILSVAFSPNGEFLASGNRDKTVKLWQVSTGREIRTFQGHIEAVTSVMFSPDGKLLASGSIDKSIKLWTIADGKELQTLWHSMDVSSVAFSPDGKLLASGSSDKTIKLWTIADTPGSVRLLGHSESVRSVAFSPDGKLLASGGWDKARLWTVLDGQELFALQGDLRSVSGVAFSPDGKLLAAGSTDSRIKLWTMPNGREFLSSPIRQAYCIAFNPDGTLLASCNHGSAITLWQTANGMKDQILQEHSEFVYSVAFSPDGRLLASGGRDKTIKLWTVSNGLEDVQLQGHSDSVNSVAFSPDGTLLASGSDDRIIKLWTVADGKEIRTLRGHFDAVSSVTFSPDGKLLASGSVDKTIKLWKVDDGQEISSLTGHSESVTSVTFSPNGKLLASSSRDKTIMIWNLDLEDRLVDGCKWLQNYLKTNPDVSTADRALCADLLTNATN